MATSYATAWRGDPAQVYRQVDLSSRIGGASPHRLVAILYEDLEAALRQAAFATEQRRFEIKSARLTKALAILFSLESGLDWEKGGELSETLSRVYRGARTRIGDAGLSGDADALREVADGIADIADAWRQISG